MTTGRRQMPATIQAISLKEGEMAGFGMSFCGADPSEQGAGVFAGFGMPACGRAAAGD